MAESLTLDELSLADDTSRGGSDGGVLRRLLEHRLAAVSLVVFVLFVLAAFVGQYLWRYGYAQLTPDSSVGPSAAHPFGTDSLGHDLLAQVLRGMSRSIEIAAVISLVGTALGAAWGVVAAFYRGIVGAVMMRIVDIVLMLPIVVLAAVLAENSGGSWWQLGLVLGGLLAPSVSRVVRARALSIREREFVASARAQGASDLRIILRHIVPNVADVVIVSATLVVAAGVLAESSLSFLGFGIQPPDTSLGLLVANASSAVDTRPWLFYFPGLVILVLTLSINFLGDGLRDVLDPRAERRATRTAVPVDEPARTAAPDTRDRADDVLRVRGLGVSLPGPSGWVHAVRGVDLSVARGEVLAIVGESGSGKSATALAIMGLLPRSARVRGSILLHGEELVGLADRRLVPIRGSRIALIPQDPTTALNPVYRVGWQLAETMRLRGGLDRAASRSRAIELLEQVGISDAAGRARQYPRQLSGGMRQRVVIAMAIANDPDVIVADEPTTALDVTVQAQILDVLLQAQRRTGSALVLITHNLGVVAGIADRVAVMYAGRAVEVGPVDPLFARPAMPYTLGLLGSLPRIEGERGRPLTAIRGSQPEPVDLGPGCAFAARCPVAQAQCESTLPQLQPVAADSSHRAACLFADTVAGRTPVQLFRPSALPASQLQRATAAPSTVLEVEELTKTFRAPARRGARRPAVAALRGVSFELAAGQTLAIAGESGCGKTTLSRAIVGLERPTSGDVRVDGVPTLSMAGSERQRLRADLQLVFQDPYASLDPRMTIGQIVAEPLRIHHRYQDGGAARVRELLDLVALDGRAEHRYPHQLSGGQRQRVGIARALALNPKILVLDEPVSALDASVQAGVLNLLARLQRELALSYVFISHDLSVIRHLADRVAIMYLGEIVELGTTAAIFNDPQHPYTRALISAIPVPDPPRQRARTRIVLRGETPSAIDVPGGCPFHSRCPTYQGLPDERDRQRCRSTPPVLAESSAAHSVACHFPASVPTVGGSR